MRDAINLTKAGHPAVVIVQSHFERAARAQAQVLGVPDLRIYSYQYDSGGSDAIEEAHAEQAAVECQKLLVGQAV